MGAAGRKVVLDEVGLPPLETADELPQIAAEEYERRMDALLAAARTDWVVVYGDPEHVGNLAYLCGFDPRFEEALLVLGRGTRRLIVGTEGVDYAPISPVAFEVVEVPTFSVMGLDRSRGTTLEAALSDAGIGSGDSVGVVGWKALQASEWSLSVPAIVAPAYVVDALRARTGGPERVVDVTTTLIDAESGLRVVNTADQLALYEWGASRASAAVFNVIRGAEPGMTEQELIANMGYRGEPLSHRAVTAAGASLSVLLRSPTTRRAELGDAMFSMIGMWGGSCGRGGMLAADEQDLRSEAGHYVDEMAIPYWRTIVGWWELVRIGVSGGEVYDALADLCRAGGFEPPWGVGHFMDFEDWPNTPLRKGSPDRVRSGMLIATDIYSGANGPARMAHCQDPVGVADADLRGELAERHPAVWARIVARREHLRERLGIDAADELLPLTVAPAYLAPFWLGGAHTPRVVG